MTLRLPKTRGMLRREAATWLVRLQSGRDPDVEHRFRRWHDADPRHADAYARVSRSYDRAGLLRHSPAVASGQHQPGRRQAGWQRRAALAAALAALVLIPVGLLVVRGSGPPSGGTEAVMLMTGVGEIRQVELADGSKVTLDTATRLDVEIGRSRRTAHLRSGRARFEVAQAGMPFVVDTPVATISTRQGLIDIEQGPGEDRVEVLAGAADVGAPDQATRVALGPGEAVAVGPAGARRAEAAQPAPDWTRGMLQFDGTPLPEAVALANRYSQRRIVLAGNLAQLRVTGAFRAGDTEGLARALAEALHLSLQRRADGSLILSPTGTSTLQKKKGG